MIETATTGQQAQQHQGLARTQPLLHSIERAIFENRCGRILHLVYFDIGGAV
jgi:hypothetical protein